MNNTTEGELWFQRALVKHAPGYKCEQMHVTDVLLICMQAEE